MNEIPLRFEGQVILVTGAAGGLGFAYARQLARRGAQVVLQDVGANRDGQGRDPAAVAAAVERLRAEGLAVDGSDAPIDDRAQCHALIDGVLQRHGQLDALVHNAGWVAYQPVESVDDHALDQMIAIAAKAPLWLAQAAWPALRAAQGRIVLTTSDRALYPQYVQEGLGAYAMAKMAAVGLAHVLAAEGHAHGIRVNVVSPVAKTRMWGVQGEPDELHPDAVAQGVVYLASKACTDSGWILRASNGQFHATRMQEARRVAYPRDLNAVNAATAEAVRDAWPRIAPHVTEPRG